MPDTLSPAQIQADVQRALDEDVGSGDLTASLVPTGRRLTATIICRESAILCGQPWVNEVLHRIAPSARVQWHLQDGQRCTPGATVLTIEGEARELLTAERTCLNFLQTLSAVATRTAQYVEAVRGTRAAILDTRKTIPGLRTLQKYATRCGGATLHRIGLFDGVILKDNHLAAFAGVPLAERVRAAAERARTIAPVAFVECEVDDLAQLDALLSLERGVLDLVLLDNMDAGMLTEAVRRRDRAQSAIELEASGGVRLDTVRRIASSGVERISVGAITHSAGALDLGLDLEIEGDGAAR